MPCPLPHRHTNESEDKIKIQTKNEKTANWLAPYRIQTDIEQPNTKKNPTEFLNSKRYRIPYETAKNDRHKYGPNAVPVRQSTLVATATTTKNDLFLFLKLINFKSPQL